MVKTYDPKSAVMSFEDADGKKVEIVGMNYQEMSNSEVVARRICSANGLEYESHTVDENGMLHLTARARGEIHSMSIECKVSV